jgi:hypothetical protein
MRAALLSCVLVTMASIAAFTADSPVQELFNRVRRYVLENVARVPRYTCVQTVTRKQFRPLGGLQTESCQSLIASRAGLSSPGVVVWHDRLRLDVAVGEDSEIFSWAGARQFETGNLNDLALSGSTGSGDFGAFLGSVFGKDAEGFRFIGNQDIPLGRFAAFEYTVPLGKSHYMYRMGSGENRTVGYRGTFYASQATGELKRLVVDASEFPSGEVCRVYDTMDYNTVKIGSGSFLLPEVSRMNVLYRGGQETENETHYSGCHEFTGESTIRFDDPDESNSPVAAARAALKGLPPKTQIRVKIDPPINSATAAAGDPITGVVEREVRQKGQILVRKTDRLHGRLLRLEQFMVPAPYWLVAIKFEAIERDGVEEPMQFSPLDDGDRTPPEIQMAGRRMQTSTPQKDLPKAPPGAGIFAFSEVGNLVLDQRFHSTWETK